MFERSYCWRKKEQISLTRPNLQHKARTDDLKTWCIIHCYFALVSLFVGLVFVFLVYYYYHSAFFLIVAILICYKYFHEIDCTFLFPAKGYICCIKGDMLQYVIHIFLK